jgi:transposase-like protein
MPVMETMARKKPRPRRSFTPEFKSDIDERCRTGDRTVGQVAKDFDLTETAVREWIKQAERDEGGRDSITEWEHPRHPGLPDLPLQRARRFPLSEVLATRKDQALAHLIRPRRRGAPPPSGLTPSQGGPASEVFIT